ncbi:MAG: acyltransferase [Chitinophagaceae bacterium]|nr:MAG: acyltransferase [Chitinophagaceae bacterium]
MQSELLKKNSFDFLRLLATIYIVFHHSFELLLSKPQFNSIGLKDFRVNLEVFALAIFFSISGYLIAKSASTSKNIIHFLWKRFLRIQPLLFIVCIASILIGAMVSIFSFENYFQNFQTWKYLRNVFPLFGIEYSLPGVFKGNIGDAGVNGSLWTIVMEERLYLIISVLFFTRIKNFFNLILFTVILLNTLFFISYFSFKGSISTYFSSYPFQFALMFINAAAFFYFKIPFFKTSKIFISILLLLVIIFPSLLVVKVIILPFVIIWIGCQKSIFSNVFYFGDISYCTYISSFPIQQMIIYNFKNAISPEKLFLLTMLFCLPLSLLSYNFIEKKFLNLKNAFWDS